MARRKKAVTGLVNELAAQLDLAKDPNILVFTPLGGLGPVDIVTLNMNTGEYNAYDVKTKNYRKKKITHLVMVIKETLKDLLSIVKQLWNKKN